MASKTEQEGDAPEIEEEPESSNKAEVQQQDAPFLQFPDEAKVHSLEATVAKVQRALEPYHGAMLFSAGLFTCFYGQHFPYSVLFWRSFANTGLPVARTAVSEFKERYIAVQAVASTEMEHAPKIEEAVEVAKKAVARLQALQQTFHELQESGDGEKMQELANEIDALQADIGPLQETATSLLKISKELQPSRLMEVGRSLYDAVVLSLKNGLMDGSSCLFLPFNVGDFTARRVNAIAEPGLRSILSWVVAKGGNAFLQVQEDENAKAWIDWVINGMCRSMGIAAAFMVERRLFSLVNARLGGMMMAKGAESILGLPAGSGQTTLLGYVFFGAGVYYQVFLQHGSGGRGTLNGAIRWCITPPKMGSMKLMMGLPLAAETWLQALVGSVRATA